MNVFIECIQVNEFIPALMRTTHAILSETKSHKPTASMTVGEEYGLTTRMCVFLCMRSSEKVKC